MHAVVIGGGVAGTSCAEALISWAALEKWTKTVPRVTVVAASSAVCLGRALAGTERLREVSVHTRDGYEWARGAGANFVRAQASKLNTESRTITLDNGENVQYDVLCIATGASPHVPEALRNPATTKLVHLIRDAQSIMRLKPAVAAARSVLVLGNGGVALEAVHALKNVDITWAFRDKHPGSAFFDGRSAAALLAARQPAAQTGVEAEDEPRTAPANAAALVAAAAGAHGDALGAAHGPFWLSAGALKGALSGKGALKLVPEVEATSAVAEQDGTLTVSLSDGQMIRYDLAICGAGVDPNVSLASGARIALGDCGGILVAAGSMKSSAERVFAAGDCSAVEGEEVGPDWFQRRLWTQAHTAGARAGRSMVRFLCGKEKIPDHGMEFELFAHATRFLGLRVAFLGRYRAQGLPEGYKILEDLSDNSFVRVVLSEGRVRGALLIGEAVDRSETYENLILGALQVEYLGAALVALDTDIADYFD